MTDMRADEPLPGGEDRLPWLEAVEDEDYDDGPSAGKMVALVLIGLAVIGLVVGGLFWLGTGRPAASGGEPELIAAPAGDYKVRPDDPGGMKVDGKGDSAFAASEGADPKGSIDAGALPEAPMARPAPAAKAPVGVAKAPAPTPAPAPRPVPASGGATIQLGAFSSQAAATSAWKAMSGRFGYLAPLTQSIVPVAAGGKTLYRLRASGADANSVCSRLRIAGEQCVAVQ